MRHRKRHASPEPIAAAGIYQSMTVSDSDKVARLNAVASNFRQTAAETGLPRYRARLLNAARELESEAARLDGQLDGSPPADSSRPR